MQASMTVNPCGFRVVEPSILRAEGVHSILRWSSQSTGLTTELQPFGEGADCRTPGQNTPMKVREKATQIPVRWPAHPFATCHGYRLWGLIGGTKTRRIPPVVAVGCSLLPGC